MAAWQILILVIVFLGALALALVGILVFGRRGSKNKRCTEKITGKVVEYSLGVYADSTRLPVVEYEVNGVKYKVKGPKFASYNVVNTTTIKEHEVVPPYEDPLDPPQTYHARIYRGVVGRGRTYSLEFMYPVGMELPVYYNPTKPEQAYVIRPVKSSKLWTIFMLIWSVVLLVLAGILIALFTSINSGNVESITPGTMYETVAGAYSTNTDDDVVQFIKLSDDNTFTIDRFYKFSSSLTEDKWTGTYEQSDDGYELTADSYVQSTYNTQNDIINRAPSKVQEYSNNLENFRIQKKASGYELAEVDTLLDKAGNGDMIKEFNSQSKFPVGMDKIIEVIQN